ncbi:hypothetical protein RJ640_006000 [Escallonia rubra]|uniref:DUF676 domain-containing protein n=1 Tax=Escallonia rubra TaxID=112253 RepID=A0AA88UGL6_9ASTE|nr:hypothetical protein RJ640_006000 [Escallonia rubra]
MDLQRRSSVKAEQVEAKMSEMDLGNVKRKKKRKHLYVPKFGCFRSHRGHPVVEKSDGDGGFDVESTGTGKDRVPTHLVVMVNGIIGSAQNWRFAAKQFVKKYPSDVIVHSIASSLTSEALTIAMCAGSESNSAMLTFDGVDVMGKRLADEVLSVIKRHPDLQKISFIGHSLGGLVARYAIAKLYGHESTRKTCQDGECHLDASKDSCPEEKLKGNIAGLEPVNFITSASPHLGSRGHKQVPVLCGFYTMEKVASRTSWFLGRTGKNLFLTDTDGGKPPLLLQMVSDCEDLQFMSALRSFKRRVAYANARFDRILLTEQIFYMLSLTFFIDLVGWSTSSLRRRNELPKRQQLSRHDKYPHIVNVEAAESACSQQEISLDDQVNGYNTDEMEETMLRALTKLSWERVDVSFSGSKQRYLAHSTIQAKFGMYLMRWGIDAIMLVTNFSLGQVKSFRFNSDGADVVQHMVDNFVL